MKYIKNFENQIGYNGRNYDSNPNIQLVKSVTDDNDGITYPGIYGERDRFEGDIEGVEDALNRGADPNFIHRKMTPLEHLALKTTHGEGDFYNLYEIAQILIDNGAKFKDSAIIDIINSNPQNTDQYDEMVKLINLMIKNGVNINYQDENGYTAIMLDILTSAEFIAESAKFDTRIFNMLVRAGADLCIENIHKEDFMNLKELTDQYGREVANKIHKKIKKILEIYKDQENVKNWIVYSTAGKYNL